MNKPSLEHIFNFYQVSEKLATSGQPQVDDFGLIKDAGYSVVVNLATCDSPNAISNERELVEAEGITYRNIPINFAAPELHELENFFQLMEEYKNTPVFVHCAYNWRTSVFIYLYRVIKQNQQKDKAMNDLMTMWDPDRTWREFIDQALAHYS